jgi:hypothetical protein
MAKGKLAIYGNNITIFGMIFSALKTLKNYWKTNFQNKPYFKNTPETIKNYLEHTSKAKHIRKDIPKIICR